MAAIFNRAGRMLTMAALACGLSACASTRLPMRPRPTVTVESGEPWRHAATAKDEVTLGRFRADWAAALAQARKGGFAKALEREGGLFEPTAALPRPAPSPGAYSCRLFTLGAASAKGRPFVAGRSAFCFVGVEGGQLSFTADLTPVRIGGYLWEQEGATQLTLLGSAVRGKGGRLPPYGESPTNDVPGVFERIGEFRYRLVLASSALGGQIALLELKPVVPQS